MKTALIIGGTAGIGREMTAQLEFHGYKTFTISRKSHPSPRHFVCDVGEISQFRGILSEVKQEFQSLDMLVCVVGFAKAKPSFQLSSRDWEETINKNLTYVQVAFEELADHLNDSSNPRGITFGSRWSYQKNCDELQPYILTKHALRTLTEDLAKENKGFIVNNYCVPPMDTPGFRFVKDSFLELPSGMAENFNIFELGEPSLVAKSIVNHILKSNLSGKTFVVSYNGCILQLN